MSNEMKGFLTTLDLVMQDKVEPETVLEEDEIEETLTINEDGEIINELTERPNWMRKDKNAGIPGFPGGRNWQGDDEANSPTRVTPKWKDPNKDVEGGRDLGDVDAQTQAMDDFSSEYPIPATTMEKLKKIPSWYWDNIKDAVLSAGRGLKDDAKVLPAVAKDLWSGGVKNALTTVGKHAVNKATGVKDFGKRRHDAMMDIVNSGITVDDANIILEDWEIFKQEELNDIKRLSGLKEAKPGSMSTAFGKNQWRVEEEDDGWQVYIWSEPNNDWIAQGQPHKTQAEAEKDAKSFFD